MRHSRAISLSFALHLSLLGMLLYSAQLSVALIKRQRNLQSLGAIQVDLTYKPTDTAMKAGPKEKDLPPPKVEEKKDPEAPTLKTKALPKPAGTKPDLKSILDKIRAESKTEDARPKPKEDNFPTVPTGEKGAHGTGGRSLRAPTPAEQALQSAMRRHFELEEANTIRKQFPNAMGFYNIRLVGYGSQFKLSAIELAATTGLEILDRKCEIAIREAVNAEYFSNDVIRELNGKETTVVCKP